MADFYCYVVNGVIERYNIQKPKAHGNTAFGAGVTDEELSEHGYFPIVGEAPAYDSATQRLEGPVYAVGDGVVTRTYQVVAKPLADLQASKREAVNAECDRRMSLLVATYPVQEVATFAKQETEARAYVADNAAATPLIDAMALNRDIPKAELVARIIAKADAFAAYAGKIVGYRQKLEDMIDAATIETIGSIDPLAGWPE